jgi:hypothetical protein
VAPRHWLSSLEVRGGSNKKPISGPSLGDGFSGWLDSVGVLARVQRPLRQERRHHQRRTRSSFVYIAAKYYRRAVSTSRLPPRTHPKLGHPPTRNQPELDTHQPRRNLDAPKPGHPAKSKPATTEIGQPSTTGSGKGRWRSASGDGCPIFGRFDGCPILGGHGRQPVDECPNVELGVQFRVVGVQILGRHCTARVATPHSVDRCQLLIIDHLRRRPRGPILRGDFSACSLTAGAPSSWFGRPAAR